jgi:hypothetical protein
MRQSKPTPTLDSLYSAELHNTTQIGSAHFDLRGRVRASNYDLAFKRADEKFVLSDKQLTSVVDSDWRKTWDYVRAPGYYNNHGQIRQRD